VHLQRPLGQRLAQLADERRALDVTRVLLGLVEAQAPGAAPGRVHGHVGPLEQRRALRAVVGGECHDDAGADLDLELVERDRLLEGVHHPATHAQRGLLLAGDRQQHGELVAAEAGDETEVPDAVHEAPGHLLQEAVALRVPERVVHVLEAVQVEDHHRGTGGAACLHELQGVADLPLQPQPVGQAGQGVVQRVVAQLVDQLTVLERHAGVVGDGLEQQDVVALEGAQITEPVGDEQRPDGATISAERHDDGVGPAARAQVGPGVVVGGLLEFAGDPAAGLDDGLARRDRPPGRRSDDERGRPGLRLDRGRAPARQPGRASARRPRARPARRTPPPRRALPRPVSCGGPSPTAPLVQGVHVSS
jgi:hypothetical protein